jgi:DNA invertase Pin-like site-specific DNA recombinase
MSIVSNIYVRIFYTHIVFPQFIKVEFFNHHKKGLIFHPKNNTIEIINVCLLVRYFRTDYGDKKMSSKIFYYARVSSKTQNEDRQIQAFKSMGADDRDIIIDKESGKDLIRPGYMALKTTMLREGDTLIITELDRLSRKKSDIKKELEYFKENNIRLKILNMPTTMVDFPEDQSWVQDMVNNILIEVLGSIAEDERNRIRKRQEEGIAAAKAMGVKLGRPTVQLPSNWEATIRRWKNGDIKAVEAMKLTGIKKNTFYKLVKETSYLG